jgi:hypothetical protein
VVAYLRQGTNRLRKIAVNLARLRDRRNEADYALKRAITSKNAHDACSIASQAAGEFESLSEPEIQGAIKRMRDLR